ncbi:hypothetical protein SLA2020_255760 [Shorea laevis]
MAVGHSGSVGNLADSYKGMSADNTKGLVLALSSSFFIGASFIVKKKGLKKVGSGCYSYLFEPLWWMGMITMIVGEIANFAAYAFAPAILVTLLGALSIIISAALAHTILCEKLNIFGILGCVLCVVGSTAIFLHAPREREINSVKEVWDLATELAFLMYAATVLVAVFRLIFQFVPQYGQSLQSLQHFRTWFTWSWKTITFLGPFLRNWVPARICRY